MAHVEAVEVEADAVEETVEAVEDAVEEAVEAEEAVDAEEEAVVEDTLEAEAEDTQQLHLEAAVDMHRLRPVATTPLLRWEVAARMHPIQSAAVADTRRQLAVDTVEATMLLHLLLFLLHLQSTTTLAVEAEVAVEVSTMDQQVAVPLHNRPLQLLVTCHRQKTFQRRASAPRC